jgi:nitroimidazol reductase NimA-like FMN-containing flavoprotein (pyridoxamine 5'-phosphate oxidase superfamily)
MSTNSAEEKYAERIAARLAAPWVAWFLQLPILARLATAGAAQRPHVVPVWFEWDGVILWISIDQRSKKYRNLVGNPFAAVTIDETWGGLRFRGVIFEGPVELITEPRTWTVAITERIYTRYMGQEGIATPTIQSMLLNGQHAVIKLTPAHVIVWDDTHGPAPAG